jgi:hypothetical protein
VDAVRDCRADEEVKRRLADLEGARKVRPLLIRRHRSRGDGTARVFAASLHSGRPWVETTVLDDVRDLLDMDLDGLGEGRSPGLTRHAEPLFLVCTHGRHDACCAERGRPLCTAMADAAPDHTWEVSHIGGDRFAANVLVLPQGLYYGRLTPDDAERFAAEHLAGRLDLEHLRGRSSYPFPVQAAEVYLRRHLDLHRADALPIAARRRNGPENRVVFAVDGRSWEVRVHTESGRPRQLTCRATTEGGGLVHPLLGLAEV